MNGILIVDSASKKSENLCRKEANSRRVWPDLEFHMMKILFNPAIPTVPPAIPQQFIFPTVSDS